MHRHAWLASLALAALVCACAAGPREITQPTPKDFAATLGQDHITLGLANGESAELRFVRDFGGFLCGSGGCVRKADIVSIRYPGTQVSPARQAGSLALVAVALPVALPVVAVASAACAASDCKNPPPKSDTPGAPPPPEATNRQLERAWLDGLKIDRKRLVGQEPNPCFSKPGAPAAGSFASEAEAFDWVWAHYRQLSSNCLISAGQRMKATGAEARRRAFVLMTYHDVRGDWTTAHCVSTHGDPDATPWRVVPSPLFDISLHRGDPALVAEVEAVFADPTTQDWQAWSAEWCRIGVLPEAQWPNWADWEARHRPVILGAARAG